MGGKQHIIRRQPALAVVVALGLIAFGGVAVATGNREFVFYGAVMAGLIALVVWLDARVRFSTFVLWGLAVWALAHLAGGTVPIPAAAPKPEGALPVLYSLWLIPRALKFDMLVHAFGFFVATLVCWEALAARIGVHAARAAGPVALAALAGMGLGAFNEIVEFAAVKLLPETNVGGYDNTGWDLIANAVGALLAGALLALRAPADAESASLAP